MTAAEMVQEVRSNAQFFQNDAPFVDGFSEEDRTSGHTSVLAVINRTYRGFVRLGFLQCWRDLQVLAGTRDYQLPGTFTFVHSGALIDSNGKYWPLTPIDYIRYQVDQPYNRNYPSRRPMKYYFTGGMVGFDVIPDRNYELRMLCDVDPDPLVDPDDVPDRLDTILHDCIVDDASERMSRRLLAQQGVSDAAVLRYRMIAADAKDAREYVRSVARARVIAHSEPPLVNDVYRMG